MPCSSYIRANTTKCRSKTKCNNLAVDDLCTSKVNPRRDGDRTNLTNEYICVGEMPA